MPLIVDAHEDLAWNILTFGRDYTRAAAETRRLEAGTSAVEQNGETLLGWPDYQRGEVAIVFATLFAPPARRRKEWERLYYTDPDSARRLYLEQAQIYRRLTDEHPGKFRLICSIDDLAAVLADWKQSGEHGHPVGLVLLMEGAEAIRSADELSEWWELGLRIIGPAWAGTRYCGGTREPGPLTDEGRHLLAAMADFNFTLDLSHMDEEAALQALDYYPGPIAVTHANCAALLPGTTSNRHLSDRLTRGVIERDGVIGLIPYNTFLKPGWQRSDGREQVRLEALVAHVDHVCQIAGDARHAGLGTDFDGGFGLQSAPADLDTIADLQHLVPLLISRGYLEADAAAVLGQNWLDHLYRSLPSS